MEWHIFNFALLILYITELINRCDRTIYSTFLDHNVTDDNVEAAPAPKKRKLGLGQGDEKVDLDAVFKQPLPRLQDLDKKSKLGSGTKHQKVDLHDVFDGCFSNLAPLIKQESDVQAILQGCFLGKKYEGQNVMVFNEASYGSGRADLAVLIQDKEDTRKEKVLVLETKIRIPGSSKSVKELFFDATVQLGRYKNFLKSSTDSKKVSTIPFIYDRVDKKVYLHQLDGKVDHTSHSSSAEQGPSKNNQNYKKGHESVIASHEILSKMFEKGIFDFSEYNLDTIDYIALKIFLLDHRPEPQRQVTCVLNLSNQKNILKNIDIVAEILQHDLWISDLIIRNGNLNNKDALKKLTDALISKETLTVIMSGSDAQKAYLTYLSQKKYADGGKHLGLKVLDLSDTRLHASASIMLSNVLSHMLSLERFAVSHLENNGLQHIFNGLMRITTLVSLKVVEVNVGLDTARAEGLVNLFDRHPNLNELDVSNNKMGQVNIDIILQGAQEKGIKLQVCDLSYNIKDAQEVINTESLKKFISFYKNTLKTLKWKGNRLGDQELNALSASFQESKIEVLDLSHNEITAIDGDKLSKTLTSLIIHHNKIVVFTRGQLNHLENLSETLDVTYNTKLTNVCDVMNLAIVAHTKHLGLSGIDFGNDFHVTAFNELWRHGEDLTSLSVPNCNIDDKQAKILLNILELPIAGGATKLKKLNCENNHIEINDKKVISGKTSVYDETGFIVFSDSIEEVILKGNKIGDEGGKHLLDAFHARSKEFDVREQRGATTKISIDLSDNPLTDVFAQDLANKLPLLKGFKSMKLRGCSFTKRYKNQLVNAVGDNGNKDITSLEIDHLSSDEQRRIDSYLIRNNYEASSTPELRLKGDDEFEVIKCLHGGRSKRYISGCKISWDDVDEISRERTRDKEKIFIDAEKFLKYSKEHAGDIEKSKQLVSLVNEIKLADSERIVGKYQNTLDQVIKLGSYRQHIENDRLSYLGRNALIDDNLTPSLKAEFLEVTGRIQMGYGTYGTFKSCVEAIHREDSRTDCILNAAEMGYELVLEPAATRISSKIPVSPLLRKAIGTALSQKAASIIGHGIAVGGIAFDVIDIVRSSIDLSKCSHSGVCSEKDIRDNIASIVFAGLSYVSTIAISCNPVLAPVGFIIFISRILYSGISSVLEASKKYDTTSSENWSIFLRTILLQKMSKDVGHLFARHDSINQLVQEAYNILKDSPKEVVGISLGLAFQNVTYNRDCSVGVPEIFLAMPVIGIACEAYSLVCETLSEELHYTIASYSRIDMSKKHEGAIKLSRVLPKNIENYNMPCLPKITNAEYEKGLYQLRPGAVYECDNAVVILNKQKASMQSAATNATQIILHYLKYISSGLIVGSLEYNNYFDIFKGNASIFGTSVPFNIFNFLDESYSGKIYLSGNGSNIINLSGLQKADAVNVEYLHTVPLSMQITISINGTASVVEALEENVKATYVSSSHIVDNILCSRTFIDPSFYNTKYINDMVVDSGGVEIIQDGIMDTITNCTNVLLSPNTRCQSTYNEYTNIYIKRPDYESWNTVHSYISTSHGADIVFYMPSLIPTCKNITYDTTSNSLVLNIDLLRRDVFYQITLENYLNHKNETHYKLLDQEGRHVIPILRLDSRHDTYAIEKFVINVSWQYAVDLQIYNYISYTPGKEYEISAIIRDKSGHIHMFGSTNDDLLTESADVLFMRGGNGNDVYTIDYHITNELRIDNQSDDLEVDSLAVQSIRDVQVIRNEFDAELSIQDKKIILLNYCKGKTYQHMMLIDQEGTAAVVLCAENNQISLLPFYHTFHQSQNIYILSHDIAGGVIGIHSKNIAFYQKENDLIITDKLWPFGILSVVLKDYQSTQWKGIRLYSYENGATGDVIDLSNIQLSKADFLIPHIYNSTVHEYIVDLSKRGEKIADYNEHDTSIILLHNMSLDHLIIASHKNNTNHLILRHSVSHHNLVLQHWYKKEHKKILALEFNDGVEASRILLSDGFEHRINLNHKLNDEIAKIGSNVLTAVLDFMVSYCAMLHIQNNNDYENSFLIKEFENVIKTSGTFNAEEVVQILGAPNYNASTVLMLLLTKNYNGLLLEYPHIEEKDLLKMGQNCFDTMVSNQDIVDLIQLLNSTSVEYTQIDLFIGNRNNKMQKIIKQYAHADWSNSNYQKHRHHHGDDVQHQVLSHLLISSVIYSIRSAKLKICHSIYRQNS